jgi:6-phosphogluconolactonase
MTTTVPLIYSFPEFAGVADAVADHVISAQNMTLYQTLDKAQIQLLREKAQFAATSMTPSAASSVATSQSNSNLNGMSLHTSTSNVNLNGKKKEKKSKRFGDTRFKVALSGGSLIKILNQGLLNRQLEIEWDKWDIYFGDERLVPFDSPDSNYGQAKREIFDHITGDKKPNIYHADDSLFSDPQEAADNYEKVLIKNFAKKDSVKLPLFDIVLLGCAPDGHIASLFPGHQSLRENLAWVLPVEQAPSGPENRITLSIPVICHAQRVSFVVEGLTKANIVRTIMERPEKGLPASIVHEGAAGRVTWFVDDDALKECYEITKKDYKFLLIDV